MSTVLVRTITSAFSSYSSTILIYSQSSSLSQLSLSSLLSRSFFYKNSLRVSLDRLRSLQQSTLLKTSASTHCLLIQHWPLLICQMPLTVKKTGCSVSRGGGCHGAEQPIVSDFLIGNSRFSSSKLSEIFFFVVATLSIPLLSKVGSIIDSL